MARSTGEKTPGGSTIDRFKERPREFEFARPGEGTKAVEAHLARYFGQPQSVFHEPLSDLIHVDVHVVPPRPERNHWTLFTTGMSDRPMTVPAGAEAYRFAELVLALPAEWDVAAIQAMPAPPELDAVSWPIRWIHKLARFPHEAGTWLGTGHSMPNENRAALKAPAPNDTPPPFSPETELCAWLLLPPVSIPEEGRTLTLPDGRTVHVYCLHALHADELRLNLEKGTDALIRVFNREHVSEVLQLRRPSSVRPHLDLVKNRYEGKPLLRFLELYVIWAIGELSDDEAAWLQELTPKLREIYSVDGSWQDVLASVMNFGPTIPSALCGMWSRNLETAREHGLTLTPQHFAEQIVDQNWANL